MKIPDKIYVYGKPIIIVVEELEDMHGYFQADLNKIALCPKLKGEEKTQTFLHECFHAVLHRTGITGALHDTLEEPIVDCLATFMVENFEIRMKRKKKTNE